MERTLQKKISSRDDRIINFIVYLFCTIVLILTVYPLVFVVSASVSEPKHVALGEVILLPKGLTLEGYQTVLAYDEIWIGYKNTIFYTLLGTFINLLVTLPCAYALTREELIGRHVFTKLFTFTMLFNGGLIPLYLTVKSLGQLDTICAVMLPVAMSAYNLIITKTYFQNSIPKELQEAAMIDGCRTTTLFLRIIIPLSMPIIAVIGLYYAVMHWNSYFNAMIYLSNRKLYPLQLFLRSILLENMMANLEGADPDAAEAIIRQIQVRESMKYGIVVISSLPMLMLYPFIQRYFVKGVMVGAVKG